ncbi:MAG TPA: DNA primase [Bacteroidota bacterium]|nr:DNA primase [Bacteroidota bacterium]
MRIPPETIDQIRDANDIVEIIGGFVRLRKRGKNYIGLCPFHQEKTPSFTVSQEKQMYHCFGCGKGGNVFTFVMETEKVSFVEAVRSLAERVGIALPSESGDARSSEIENLYNVCRAAGLFFHRNLETSEGTTALEYFRGRGFSEETIKTFGLGYALNSWDGLINHAKREGLNPEYLLKAGLVRTRDDGSMYDYFRGRAMFPILSTSGRVLGFGARKIRSDDPIEGKYINSPETPIYNKSRILFGLFHTKESIRSEERALLVEGYADLISLFQAGVQNVVASSGTALTSEQLQLLGRYSKKLVLVYDADSAGSSAAVRGIDLALGQDFDVQVAELPEGEDPDTFVRKHGAAEFRALVARSVSLIDFKMGRFRAAGHLTTPEGQAQAVRSVVQSIAKMKDELKRSFYVKEVAQKYELYESVLHRELERWIERDKSVGTRVQVSTRLSPPEPVEPQALTDPPAAERDVVKIALEGEWEILGYVMGEVALTDFTDPRVRSILEKILEYVEGGRDVLATSFIDNLNDPELKRLVSDVTMSRYEISKAWEEMEVEIDEPDPWTIARAAVARIKRGKIQREIEENQKRLREAVQQGIDSMPYVARHQELLGRLKEIDQLLSNPPQPTVQG